MSEHTQTASEKIVHETTTRIKKNVHGLTDKEAKQILFDMIEALIVLFVSEEPRLADSKLEVDEKIMPFFKAIAKLASEGIYAYSMQRWDPAKMKKFENKIAKFKNLEQALMLLTK